MINIDHHLKAMIRPVPLPVSRKIGLVFPPLGPYNPMHARGGRDGHARDGRNGHPTGTRAVPFDHDFRYAEGLRRG